MDPTRRLPDHLVEHARAFASGSRRPAPTKDAATVVLLRSGDGRPGGLEVYLLRRAAEMAFAAGFCVFPGGGVDPRDLDADVAWAGPPPAHWAGLLGTGEGHARALVCAAVRETFEESGVMLAGPTPHEVVSDTTGADWEEDRRRLERRELGLADLLRLRGLILRTDLLRFWGSWVTPVVEPRRYDTRFFVAELPPGQATRDVSSEADRVLWLPVREAMAAVDSQQMLMLPPTYATCLELHEFGSPGQARDAAAGRDLAPVLPEVALDGRGAYLRLPPRLVSLGEAVAAQRGES